MRLPITRAGTDITAKVERFKHDANRRTTYGNRLQSLSCLR